MSSFQGSQSQVIDGAIKKYSLASEFPQREERQINIRLMSRLMSDYKKNSAKKSIFVINSSMSCICALYNILSVINIESIGSLLSYDKLSKQANEYAVSYYITLLSVIHFIRVCVNIIGFFGIYLNSTRLISFYMILTCLVFLTRAILSIITIISLKHIQEICDYVYGTTDGVSEVLAYQYCAVLLIFLCVDAINSLIGLVQGSSSINKPKKIASEKESIRQKYYIIYNDALVTYQ